MALISNNNLQTIEYGSSGWRVIVNDNFQDTITPYWLQHGLNSNVNITGNFNLSGNFTVSGLTTLHTITTNDDMTFTDSSKGVVLTDRSDGHTYRVYVDNGTLSVEQVS